MNVFSTWDAQSSDEANSGRFYAPPFIEKPFEIISERWHYFNKSAVDQAVLVANANSVHLEYKLSCACIGKKAVSVYKQS